MILKKDILNNQILVNKGFLTGDEAAAFWQTAQTSSYRYGQRSESFSNQSQRRMSCHFDPEVFVTTKFWHRLEKVVDEPLGVLEAYMNYSESHTLTFPHCDSSEGDMTIIVYLNLEWHRGWGGYTCFFDSSYGNEVVETVVPEPGKVIFFNGNLYHSALPPNHIAPFPRFTLAIKTKWMEKDTK